MSLSQMQDESKFKKQLGEYWSQKGIALGKIPQIGGQQLNMFKLYRTVCKKGGGQAVSHNKLWKQIVDQFGLPSTCTSASFTLKNHYQKYLLGYEQRYFFGKDDSVGLPQLVAGRQRRFVRNDDPYHTRISLTRPEHEHILSTLNTQLKKQYEKVDAKQNILFVRRSKLYPSPAEVKQMVMGFETETILAINTLTLLSLNTQVPFLLAQHLQVMDAIQSYLLRHCPPTSILELECVRSLTLALRNLLANPKNHQPLLHSDLFTTLLGMLHCNKDRETMRYLSDAFCSLAHSAPQTLLSCFSLDRDSHQEQQTALDILRSLIQIQYKEVCVPLHQLTRFFLYSSLEMRETVLQILALYAEKSEEARVKILNCNTIMERVCAALTHGQGSTERQATYAANLIKSIAKNNHNIPQLKQFQTYFVAAAFNSEAISTTLAEVLYKIANYTP